jgi:hypothetical protein
MRKWIITGVVAALAAFAGAIFYSTVLFDTGLQRVTALTLGLLAGGGVYLALGSLERRIFPSHTGSEMGGILI